MYYKKQNYKPFPFVFITGSFGAGSTDELDNISSPSRKKLIYNTVEQKNNQNCKGENGSNSEPSTLKPKQEEISTKSPVKSPSRTPVTENDPLGALMNEEEFEPEIEKKVVSRVPSEIELDESGMPILFDRRTGGDWSGVVRSATFTHQDGESEEEYENSEQRETLRKPIHRSSTMPVDVGEPPNQGTTFGSLGSSFKLPFT